MKPANVILLAIVAVLLVVWIPAAAFVGIKRTDAHRLDNIETIVMIERGAR